MKFAVVTAYPAKADAEVIALTQGKKEADYSAAKPHLGREGIAELKRRKFSGKTGEAAVLPPSGDIKAAALIVMGSGKEMSHENTRKSSASLVGAARGHHFQTLVMRFPAHDTIPGLVQRIAEGMRLADYRFDKYEKSEEPTPELTVTFVVAPKQQREAKAAAARAVVVTDAAMLARDLVNEPPSRMTPTDLATAARKVARETGVSLKVWNKADIKKIPMESFLSVSAGSDQPPKLIRLRYAPARAKKHVVLVGKGITFDSGGINLKPSRGGSLEDMKMDMAGAAAVIGAISAAAKLKLPVKVTAYVAATENMTGGSASKPGDVVRAYNGKTIEILNTDCEGRLTLADVLSYAEKNDKPDAIIDLATLTATEISLGLDYAAIFGEEGLIEQLKAAGDETGEKVWPFPLPEEYQETVKGRIADLRNTGTDRGYSINGAIFLRNFVTDKTPWTHIDIGSPAGSEADRGYLKKGGTGFGVRLLIEYLTNLR